MELGKYDGANRLERIEHRNLGALLLQLEYSYDTRNLVTRIDESNIGGLVEWVEFEYDDRGRLIQEIRYAPGPGYGLEIYNLAYEYDQVGNRLRKTDIVNPFLTYETNYTYDY